MYLMRPCHPLIPQGWVPGCGPYFDPGSWITLCLLECFWKTLKPEQSSLRFSHLAPKTRLLRGCRVAHAAMLTVSHSLIKCANRGWERIDMYCFLMCL